MASCLQNYFDRQYIQLRRWNYTLFDSIRVVTQMNTIIMPINSVVIAMHRRVYRQFNVINNTVSFRYISLLDCVIKAVNTLHTQYTQQVVAPVVIVLALDQAVMIDKLRVTAAHFE